MGEEVPPISSRYIAVEQSLPTNVADVSPVSGLMHGEKSSKREKDLEHHARRANRFWQDTWAPEVLSCIVALSALVGMAVTLKLRQGIQPDK
jgi:hypothetical protein